MALLWADGLDMVAAASGQSADATLSLFYTLSGGAVSLTGRSGSGLSIRVGSFGSITRVLSSSYTTLIVGFARLPTVDEGGVLYFQASGVENFLLQFNSSGKTVSVIRGITTVDTSATDAWAVDTWDYWEIKVLFSQTVGTYEVRKNGVVILSGTGVDTCNTATESASDVRFRMGSTSYIDDIYICDASGSTNNDFLGDVEVKLKLPDADGTSEQWTPSTGVDSYALVDEVPFNSDTDYLETSTTAQISRFTHQDVDSGDTILAVVQTAVCRKTDAGSGSVRTHQFINSTGYNGSTVALSTSYQAITQILETDPNTTAAWTPAGVNAAEFGVESII